MFSAVLLYEPVYNIISLQQAIRRVWRLGQKNTVVVKALVYPGIEEFAWQVIARAISWATSVLRRLHGQLPRPDTGPVPGPAGRTNRAATQRERAVRTATR